MSAARREVAATIEAMDRYAEEARAIYEHYVPGEWADERMQQFSIVMREPLGVILCVAAFNGPLYLTAAKVVAALLAGNTMVIALSSRDSITSLLFRLVSAE